MAVILFILILSVLVLVHELGHFLAARRMGIAVEEFGVGFPPRLWGIRRGGLLISINWIPFGGFVRLQGEQGDHERRPDSFVSAGGLKQFFVLAAGVIMNYLLAWVVLSLVVGIGVHVSANTVPTSMTRWVSQRQNQAIVSNDSPASRSGLRNGETIISINGQTYTDTEQLIHDVERANYPTLKVVVETSNQQRQTISISPETQGQNPPHYGFGVDQIGLLRTPWYVAPWQGLTTTVRLTGQTFQGFGQLIGDLVQHGQVSPDLTGPVGIAVLTGQVSQLGFIAVLQFLALLSISLAVVNFLPLPALDGGRAVFVIIERFRGRPINRQLENSIHAAGFYLFLLLILAISVRDVRRFDLVSKVTHFFHS